MTETLLQAAPAVLPEKTPVSLRKELERQFGACELLRPFRRACYDPGELLDLAVTGVIPANTGRVRAEVERFVGGGFAGQVYRVTLQEIDAQAGPIEGLSVGGTYAIKILKPPTGFARLFRNFLYFLAYQGAFSAQVNPAAARVGVLWQKLIRRAAARKFGTESAVCDTYATFYDEELHSFGEINEWVDGRIWKFEVDEHLFERWNFKGEPPADLSSAEYVHKKIFMRELVNLLHEMGAPELARQYEWWTCKSQPNALKRLDADLSPREGLTAIDFRAGLALLPFLPMSPADVWLILRGLGRGRLVQFDRSDPRKFQQFIAQHRDDFEDLQPVIEELEQQEPRHRRSLPDLTHHHYHLLTDAGLRKSIRAGTITGWRNLGRIDAEHAERLERRRGLFTLLFLVSLIPLLGRFVLKMWGHARHRAHVGRMLTSWSYLCRALRGARLETLIVWHRRGRASAERIIKLVDRPVRYWAQRILAGWLPATWQRAITEPRFAWARLREKLNFVWQMLRTPAFREQWLLEEVRLGRAEGMLTGDEAEKISSQIKDPFIQKYLRCTAVHVCTVPITQIVMVLAGLAVGAYFLFVRQAGWGEAVLTGSGAAAFIQLMPISPGSLTRGLFVLYLMIRERDIRNYYIAAPISFLHVIGYLAFPLQMVAHDPALARFMAGRWAKSAVHFIPVFGETGGLPEHAVFDIFFNLPLSIKRRFVTRPLSSAIWAVVVLGTVALLLYDVIIAVMLVYARLVQ
ncbi:MAG: hypothetical protein KAY37_16455 [Phycisphaerae bacterium]|nr:hypothetical protein [Phycisphaerae bacterium]